MTKKLFTIVSFIVLTSQAFAQVGVKPIEETPATPKENCIAQEDLKDIVTYFKQFKDLLGKEVCNDNSQTWHLLSSMMFMKKTAFTEMPNSQDELFSGRFSSDWFKYFVGRINYIDVVSSCPKGVIAYVMAFGGKTMFVCPAALTDIFTSLDRASVFMHEARHIDGYPHMTCSSGPRAGIRGACDTRISGGGSYAVTVETYAQLAKYAKDLHPALRAYSKSSSIVYADEAFENKVQIQRQAKMIFMTENKNFHEMDLTTKSVKTLGQTPALGKIFKRATHMVLIPADKNMKAGYVFANNEGELPQSPGEMINEYNAQTPEEKSKLVDIHNGAQMTIRLYKDMARFSCDTSSTKTQDIQLTSPSTPVALVYPQGYSRATKSVQFVTENGDVFELGCQGSKAYAKAAAAFDQKYSRVYKVGQDTFGLTPEGVVFQIVAGRSEKMSVDLGSKIVEMVPTESYNFFE